MRKGDKEADRDTRYALIGKLLVEGHLGKAGLYQKNFPDLWKRQLLYLLADKKWHSLTEIQTHIRKYIPPGEAYRQGVQRRREGRITEATLASTPDKTVAAGVRRKLYWWLSSNVVFVESRWQSTGLVEYRLKTKASGSSRDRKDILNVQ